MCDLKDYDGYILLMDPETADKWDFSDGEMVGYQPPENGDSSIPECELRVVVNMYAGRTPRIIKWDSSYFSLEMGPISFSIEEESDCYRYNCLYDTYILGK